MNKTGNAPLPWSLISGGGVWGGRWPKDKETNKGRRQAQMWVRKGRLEKGTLELSTK